MKKETKHNKPATVGTLELSTILEEFTTEVLSEMSPGNVSLSGKIGYCKIEVWPDEGQTPHFHIITTNKVKWECCVEIYRAKYFSHGSKTGTLSNSQAKTLNAWLKKPSIPNKSISNWELICTFWYGQNNPLTNVPEEPEQPDYSKINDSYNMN